MPLIDDDAGAGHKQPGLERAELAVGGVVRDAAVVRGTDGQMILVPGQRCGERRLQGTAEGLRGSAGVIDFTRRCPVGQSAGRHHIAGVVVQRIIRIEVVAFQAEEVAVVIAGLDIGGVTVYQGLLKMPVIHIGAQLQASVSWYWPVSCTSCILLCIDWG